MPIYEAYQIRLQEVLSMISDKIEQHRINVALGKIEKARIKRETEVLLARVEEIQTRHEMEIRSKPFKYRIKIRTKEFLEMAFFCL